ncbi:hypothetical protein [Natronorubrum sp. FCH18a]|uniref:hypothetical protein n=1 Tax=Natronorubrum sp. FCH18a TaxID=3447018 RepID=UPI003F51A0CB
MTAAAQQNGGGPTCSLPKVDRVAADSSDILDTIDRNELIRQDVTHQCKEVIGEIEPGIEFPYFTFGG